jgi:hypothetical protein
LAFFITESPAHYSGAYREIEVIRKRIAFNTKA